MTDTITNTTPDSHVPEDTVADGDLFAVKMRRWEWESDENYAKRLGQARVRRDAKAKALELIAARVTAHDLPMPYISQYGNEGTDAVFTAMYSVQDVATMRQMARAVRQATGVNLATKANTDGSLTATVVDGPVAWMVVLATTASPCEQVQVGTKTEVGREEISPPRYREVEREVPVYEWRCPDSILTLVDDSPEADAEA